MGQCPSGEGRWGMGLFNTNTFHPLGRVPSGTGAKLRPDSNGKKERRRRGEVGPLQSGSRLSSRATFPEHLARVDS